MIHTGKCPKCERVIDRVTIDQIDAYNQSRNVFNAVSYLCPHCQTVLSVQIDPLALKTDTVNDLLKALKKR